MHRDTTHCGQVFLLTRPVRTSSDKDASCLPDMRRVPAVDVLFAEGPESVLRRSCLVGTWQANGGYPGDPWQDCLSRCQMRFVGSAFEAVCLRAHTTLSLSTASIDRCHGRTISWNGNGRKQNKGLRGVPGSTLINPSSQDTLLTLNRPTFNR